MDKFKANLIRLVILFFVTTVLFIILWLNTKSDLRDVELSNTQNVAALNSKIEEYKKDSLTVYRKLASVQNLNKKLENENKSLNDLLEEKNETILSQQKIIIQLNSIVDSTQSVGDSITIPNYLVGHRITFAENRTSFYSLKAAAILGNPSILSYNLHFNPFELIVLLSRNKEGLWSGYTSISPPQTGEYITITGLDVVVDRDDYLGVEDNFSKFIVDIGLGGGLLSFPEVYAHFGASVLINRTHQVSYSHGVSNNLSLLDYKYFFNIINK